MQQNLSISKTKQSSFILTASHEAVLTAVLSYHMLTCEQLCLICNYSKGSLSRMQRLTKELVTHGFLLSFSAPVTQGKAPYVYALARAGLRYHKAAGRDVREYFRPSQEVEKGYLYLRHTLSVNDFLIAASLLAKNAPDSSCQIDFTFRHERTLKQTPFRVSTQSADGVEIVTVIPDGFLDFHLTTENYRRRFCILLELDRGTVEVKNFKRKLRALLAFIDSEAYHKAFGVKTVTIAFATTAGTTRLNSMRKWTRDELTRLGKLSAADLFLFTVLSNPPFDPHWLFCSPVWHSPTCETLHTLLDMS